MSPVPLWARAWGRETREDEGRQNSQGSKNDSLKADAGHRKNLVTGDGFERDGSLRSRRIERARVRTGVGREYNPVEKG